MSSENQQKINPVENHYTRSSLENTILSALQNAGKNIDQLTVEDLAPLDEFHAQGRAATSSLASLLDIQPSQHVLDVGSGVGGPSRYLASTFGCRVTGLDLVQEYCRVADAFAKRLKLDNLLSYRQGNATQMPFENETFDVVWTQHASMNIADKKKLYGEIHRVLKPGGRFAMFDILRGANNSSDGSSMHFPVPWAKDPSISHLISQEELRGLLKEIGLQETAWEDKTTSAIDWIRQMRQRSQASGGGPPPLGLHNVVGPQWPEFVGNALKNLEEGKIAVGQGIFSKG